MLACLNIYHIEAHYLFTIQSFHLNSVFAALLPKQFPLFLLTIYQENDLTSVIQLKQYHYFKNKLMTKITLCSLKNQSLQKYIYIHILLVALELLTRYTVIAQKSENARALNFFYSKAFENRSHFWLSLFNYLHCCEIYNDGLMFLSNH